MIPLREIAGSSVFISANLPRFSLLKCSLMHKVYDVTFSEQCTSEQKVLIAGSSVFMNAIFFKSETQNE